jgi:hypothetical protein
LVKAGSPSVRPDLFVGDYRSAGSDDGDEQEQPD